MTNTGPAVITQASGLVARKPPGVNFTPLAAIDVGLDALKAAGIPFQRDQDDMDAYDIAYFSLGDGRDFAVMCYDTEPAGRPALLVSHAFVRQADISTLVVTIAEALGLPPAAFQWRSERGEPAAVAA